MSKFFQKIGLLPKWGISVGSSAKSFLKSHNLRERLVKIGRKRMSDPRLDVSEEIKKELMENRK